MNRQTSWLSLSADAWGLALEASTVMGLRAMKIAAGGQAAHDEAHRMVQEKIEAGMELHTRAMSGDLGPNPADAASKTLAHYRRKVRANRRRLTREAI